MSMMKEQYRSLMDRLEPPAAGEQRVYFAAEKERT